MKILGKAVFFLLSMLPPIAVAVVDLDAPSPAVPEYARETLQTGDTTEAVSDGTVYYNVVDAGTNNDVRTVLGVGVPADDRVFIRFQLGNGLLASGNNAALTVDGSSADVRVAIGGGDGEDFIIYIVEAPSGLSSGATVELQLDILAIPAQGATSLTYTVYETLTAALFQLPSLYEKFLADYISSVEGAFPTIELKENTADVSAGFMAFTNASVGRTRANVGFLQYEANAVSVSALTGNPVSLSEVVNETGSEVMFTGDFSFGTWYLDDNVDCISPDVDLTEAIASDDGSRLTTSFVNFGSAGFNNLCVSVDGETMEIQADEYSVSSEPLPASVFAVADPASVDGVIGLIDRNGTEIKIPSLTTFSEYQQRIAIVNYRDIPVDYALDFIAEQGVTVTALEAASGTLEPLQKLVLRVDDVVDIEGGTECAATLAARVREGSIGVSTIQVNLADGSTDTVVY